MDEIGKLLGEIGAEAGRTMTLLNGGAGSAATGVPEQRPPGGEPPRLRSLTVCLVPGTDDARVARLLHDMLALDGVLGVEENRQMDAGEFVALCRGLTEQLRGCRDDG